MSSDHKLPSCLTKGDISGGCEQGLRKVGGVVVPLFIAQKKAGIKMPTWSNAWCGLVDAWVLLDQILTLFCQCFHLFVDVFDLAFDIIVMLGEYFFRFLLIKRGRGRAH
ncbi:hypothetical protein LMG33810_001305 [Carnimonas sp. LMG 33810]